MFFLLNKCFPSVKHQIIFTNTHRLRSRLIGWRTQKKGHAPFFSLVHPISFLLHNPYFCHPHRPVRVLVSTDADARIDRRGWLLLMFRSAKPLLSCCQTFTFAVPNRCFCSSRPPFPYLTPSFSFHIFPRFPQSAVLSCCVHPLVAVLKTVSLDYNNIMCASTMWCLNCKQLLKRV